TSYNSQLLRKLFSTDEISQAYGWCGPAPVVIFGETSAHEELQRKYAGLEAELQELESTGEQLELYANPELEGQTTAGAASAPLARAPRSPLDVLEQLANRFHLVAQQLRRRHGGRTTLEISDEYDVQDLLHALLLLEFDDVRTE